MAPEKRLAPFGATSRRQGPGTAGNIAPHPFWLADNAFDTVTAATGHRSVSTVRPAHKVRLTRYFIDIHEITIDEINPYVRATDDIDGIACRTIDSAVLSISHEELRATAF